MILKVKSFLKFILSCCKGKKCFRYRNDNQEKKTEQELILAKNNIKSTPGLSSNAKASSVSAV